MELMSSDFNNFEQKRGILVEKVTDLVKTTTKLGDTKLDESSAIDSFQEVKNEIKKTNIVSQGIRDDLLTLENYVERYLPLQMLKIIQRLLLPLFDEDHLRKLDKAAARFTMEMQQ